MGNLVQSVRDKIAAREAKRTEDARAVEKAANDAVDGRMDAIIREAETRMNELDVIFKKDNKLLRQLAVNINKVEDAPGVDDNVKVGMTTPLYAAQTVLLNSQKELGAAMARAMNRVGKFKLLQQRLLTSRSDRVIGRHMAHIPNVTEEDEKAFDLELDAEDKIDEHLQNIENSDTGIDSKQAFESAEQRAREALAKRKLAAASASAAPQLDLSGTEKQKQAVPATRTKLRPASKQDKDAGLRVKLISTRTSAAAHA